MALKMDKNHTSELFEILEIAAQMQSSGIDINIKDVAQIIPRLLKKTTANAESEKQSMQLPQHCMQNNMNLLNGISMANTGTVANGMSRVLSHKNIPAFKYGGVHRQSYKCEQRVSYDPLLASAKMPAEYPSLPLPSVHSKSMMSNNRVVNDSNCTNDKKDVNQIVSDVIGPLYV